MPPSPLPLPLRWCPLGPTSVPVAQYQWSTGVFPPLVHRPRMDPSIDALSFRPTLLFRFERWEKGLGTFQFSFPHTNLKLSSSSTTLLLLRYNLSFRFHFRYSDIWSTFFPGSSSTFSVSHFSHEITYPHPEGRFVYFSFIFSLFGVTWYSSVDRVFGTQGATSPGRAFLCREARPRFVVRRWQFIAILSTTRLDRY